MSQSPDTGQNLPAKRDEPPHHRSLAVIRNLIGFAAGMGGAALGAHPNTALAGVTLAAGASALSELGAAAVDQLGKRADEKRGKLIAETATRVDEALLQERPEAVRSALYAALEMVSAAETDPKIRMMASIIAHTATIEDEDIAAAEANVMLTQVSKLSPAAALVFAKLAERESGGRTEFMPMARRWNEIPASVMDTAGAELVELHLIVPSDPPNAQERPRPNSWTQQAIKSSYPPAGEAGYLRLTEAGEDLARWIKHQSRADEPSAQEE